MSFSMNRLISDVPLFQPFAHRFHFVFLFLKQTKRHQDRHPQDDSKHPPGPELSESRLRMSHHRDHRRQQNNVPKYKNERTSNIIPVKIPPTTSGKFSSAARLRAEP